MKTKTWAVRKHGGGIYAVTTQTLNARLVLMLVFPLVVGPHSRIYRVIVACILPPHSLCQHLVLAALSHRALSRRTRLPSEVVPSQISRVRRLQAFIQALLRPATVAVRVACAFENVKGGFAWLGCCVVACYCNFSVAAHRCGARMHQSVRLPAAVLWWHEEGCDAVLQQQQLQTPRCASRSRCHASTAGARGVLVCAAPHQCRRRQR